MGCSLVITMIVTQSFSKHLPVADGTIFDMIGAPPAGLQVTLATGETVPADAVLSAVGLRADTALAQAAGLQVDRAIVVNTFLQTSAAHIHALGDSAQYASAPSLLSAHGSTLPYVMPIMSAARALAATLAGTPTALAFALMPVSVKTPALPLVVAAAQTGLAGAQTSQRMAQAKLLSP